MFECSALLCDSFSVGWGRMMRACLCFGLGCMYAVASVKRSDSWSLSLAARAHAGCDRAVISCVLFGHILDYE